ncbi:TPA: MFS transporter [Escherichia coli]|nr:MFS transporter [Escherichia coli]EFN7306457.1 MFS transporter [Escherichia coli]EFN7350478.1 MFS transporter [Escherichia coli]EFN8636924.1 MFS transporter [Escherichia coli]EFN8717021.1 MFS transporter [Escherichia coli]
MIDVPQPMCGPEDVVIEIKAAAICGADMKHYNVDSGSDEFNSIRGHEFAGCIAMLVMDKIPRKTMGVGLLILIAVLGYIYSLQTSMLLITLIGFFLITFVYMYVCYASAVYVPEIWPTEAKLRGSGLANAVGRISGIAAPYAVAVLLSSYGVTGVFILLGAVSIIVAIAIATIGIETKGVSVESLSIDAVANK